MLNAQPEATGMANFACSHETRKKTDFRSHAHHFLDLWASSLCLSEPQFNLEKEGNMTRTLQLVVSIKCSLLTHGKVL